MFIIVWVLLIKAYYENGSWTVNRTRPLQSGCKGAECDSLQLYIAVPDRRRGVQSLILMKDPVHVDVRSEFSY